LKPGVAVAATDVAVLVDCAIVVVRVRSVLAAQPEARMIGKSMIDCATARRAMVAYHTAAEEAGLPLAPILLGLPIGRL
jgi:hypothetical protein